MTDERERRPNWDEDEPDIKTRDFIAPPREDPPDEKVPIDPPDQEEGAGEE
jgi:hypothetical protein